jgi:CheY-like chemotaxis protein
MAKSAILCVDDERTILVGLREQIARHFGDRYLYEVAESVEEAWEAIEELYIDGVKVLIIISDWLMPGIKGDEFLIEVHRRFPQIITMMLTGQADRGAIERARQSANLHAYITKPWREETLIAAIEAGLRKLQL